MDQNNPEIYKYNTINVNFLIKPKFFPHKPYFPFISQGHSKLTPVNS